ncbi:MFS transporter [Actinacidiphila paucisporea]|uniref:Predicted arabinose efflux permease, MFS family n=1 Tax=Actinacidiphila paucisporea TaxID=310782 RepID=A0A1M7P0K9_9ACTN|nr:MFS transporter [Actinacidiphila paucisporea]SHN09977.1 Predicted arabinose efflux permease, MFS family [Actinacidiphila paucisporea]
MSQATSETGTAGAARAGEPDGSSAAAASGRFRPGRDVLLLWFACATDAIGSNASGIVLPLVLLGLGHSPAFVGVVASACTATGLLVAPLVAWPADRGARKAVMFWSAVVAALATGVLAAALAGGHPPLTLLLGAVLAECVAAACYKAAAPGTVALLAAPSDVPRVVAGIEAGEQGALVLGPALGGALYQVSRMLPFAVDAVSYAVTAVCVRSMSSDLRAVDAPAAAPSGRRRGSGRAKEDGLRAGLRLIRSSPLLRLVTLWATTVNGVLAALTYQTVFALSRHGHGAAPMGLVLAVSGTAGLLGALAAPSLVARVGARRVLVAVTWLLLPPAVGLAAAGSAWAFGALFAFICLLLPLTSVVLQSCAVRAVPPGAQARVAAALTVCAGLAVALAPALTGTLAARVGTAAPPLACAAVLAALALRTTLGGPRPLPLEDPA